MFFERRYGLTDACLPVSMILCTVCVFVAATAREVQAGPAPTDDERRYGLVYLSS